MQGIKMSARDQNVQIAIAAATIVQASTGSDTTSVEYLLKAFDQAYDHILEKTRPTE